MFRQWCRLRARPPRMLAGRFVFLALLAPLGLDLCWDGAGAWGNDENGIVKREVFEKERRGEGRDCMWTLCCHTMDEHLLT